MKTITDKRIEAFENSLYMEEKAKNTVKKYIASVRRLEKYLEGRKLTKRSLMEYREYLLTVNKAQTVNGALCAINAFLIFCGWEEMTVKLLKVQRQAFLSGKSSKLHRIYCSNIYSEKYSF